MACYLQSWMIDSAGKAILKVFAAKYELLLPLEEVGTHPS